MLWASHAMKLQELVSTCFTIFSSRWNEIINTDFFTQKYIGIGDLETMLKHEKFNNVDTINIFEIILHWNNNDTNKFFTNQIRRILTTTGKNNLQLHQLLDKYNIDIIPSSIMSRLILDGKINISYDIDIDIEKKYYLDYLRESNYYKTVDICKLHTKCELEKYCCICDDMRNQQYTKYHDGRYLVKCDKSEFYCGECKAYCNRNLFSSNIII